MRRWPELVQLPLLWLTLGLALALPLQAEETRAPAAELSLEELLRQGLSEAPRDVEVSTASRYLISKLPQMAHPVSDLTCSLGGIHSGSPSHGLQHCPVPARHVAA